MIGQEPVGGLGIDLSRRALLYGFAVGTLAARVSPAVAETAFDEQLFLETSKFLTGRASLDLEQSSRLFEALAFDPGFRAEVQQLASFIRDRSLDAGQLQGALDAQAPAMAGLPRRIMTAWYTGIVGEGEAARCVTFETSLMHQVVADRLSPPSYCFGPPASWSKAPA